MNTRRQFLIKAPLGLVSVAAACRGEQPSTGKDQAASQSTPGAPVAFGTSAPSGPALAPATVVEAETLAQVTSTEAERAIMLQSWPRTLIAYAPVTSLGRWILASIRRAEFLTA